MIAAIIPWVLGKVGSGLLSNLAGSIFKELARRDSEATRRLEIETGRDIAQLKADADKFKELNETYRTFASEGTKRQARKMNSPVFWFLIVAGVGPPLFLQASLALYNVFWWENGLWPVEGWQIAAFPGQTGTWADMAMQWLYDPMAVGVHSGIAAIIARLTR